MGLISRVSSRTYRFTHRNSTLISKTREMNSDSDYEKENDPHYDPNFVNLKVTFGSVDNSLDKTPLNVKIRFDAPMEKFMDRVCRHKGLTNKQMVKFRYDGDPIKYDDTARILGLHNGSEIDVYNYQIG